MSRQFVIKKDRELFEKLLMISQWSFNLSQPYLQVKRFKGTTIRSSTLRLHLLRQSRFGRSSSNVAKQYSMEKLVNICN